MARSLPATSAAAVAGISAAATPRRIHRALRHGVGAALAVLALLSGLEFHPAAESPEPLADLGSAHQDVYYPAASHPVQPPHAETAKAAQRPFCAICFNRSQGSGARPAEAARLSALLSGPPLPAAVAVSPLQRSLRPDGARAPPVA